MAARAAVRPRVRQMDFVEYFRANQQSLKTVTAEQRRMEKSVFGYCKDAAEFVRDMRKDKKAADAEKSPAEKKESKSVVEQYYMSQDLLKRMKWKRVSWDDDADYEGFSRRIMDSDTVFSKVPSFSHMSIHLVRDKASRGAPAVDLDERSVQAIKAGTLTKWFLEERLPEEAKPVYSPPPKVRQAAFTVDWEAGTVRILDTASLQELLVYLTTTAPRVQALQQRMEDDQVKMTEEIDNMRVRLGLIALKFNKYEKTFWDDPERLKDPENYVTPRDMRLFLNSCEKRGILLRKFVRNNQVRVLPSGHAYSIDVKENEIRIPANFADYNYLPLHDRYEALERFGNFFRRTAYMWFFVVMMLVGDFEIL